MPGLRLRQFFARRLSVTETVAVILCLGLLAGAGYGVYQYVSARILESRVRSAIPILCGEARKQRAAIVKAIEAYHAQFRSYPPDNVLNRQPVMIDPVTNTLIYELSGTVFNPANGRVQVCGLEPADVAFVTNFLHCALFRNLARTPGDLKSFLSREDAQWRQLHDDPDIFVLAFNATRTAVPSDLVWELNLGSWRYVSTAPTNNPGKFDLWMDIKYRDSTVTIGNWKSAD